MRIIILLNWAFPENNLFITYHGRQIFGILGARGFFELEIQSACILTKNYWNPAGMGVLDLEFPQGTDKSLFLESAYVMDYSKEEK